MNLELETAPAAPTFGPVTKANRLVNLDFVRGVALLGILMVNIALQFGPIAAIAEPTYLDRLTGPDRVASWLVLTLFQTKFISIFSLLFGYGLLSQIERASASGQSPGWFTFRRLGVLAVFGMIHGLAIWYGDVLFIYASIGGWLLLARGASARTLLTTAVCILIFALFLRGGFEALGAAFPQEIKPVPVPERAPRLIRVLAEGGFNPASPQWLEAETIAYRDGPWLDAQMFRAFGWFANLFASLLTLGWLSLGMFFLGGALWRVKFFAPEQRDLRWKVMRICLPVGLLFEAVAAWFFWSYPPTTRGAWVVGHIIQQTGLFFLPLGYLSAFALLADRLPDGLRGPVASAGRMSLTVYLMESLVTTGLSYHWGLRWFGSVPPAWQPLLALTIWLSLVVLAHLWLQRFRQGPMEWLWRRLEYGRPAVRPEG